MAVRSPYGTHGTQGRPDVRGGHERSDEAPRVPHPAAYGPRREHPANDAVAAPLTPEFRRPSRPRTGKRAADPFDPVWVATELRALAERALRTGGAGPEVAADPGACEHTGRDQTSAADPTARPVNDQLLEALWPWAVRTAATQAARLPPRADRDAVHGEILWEVFQAVRRIDWQRYDVWPALLKARLRAAWSAAARAEDPLTRGERQARTAYLARVEAETQRLGRMLTSAERYAIARRLRPSGGTATVVAGRRLLSSAGGPGGLGDPAAIVQAATATTPDDDPADLLQRHWLRCAVRRWVAHDLPPDLRNEVSALLERDEADHIGHALLRRLAPYATALHRRIDD